MNTEPITVATVVEAPLEKVWTYFTEPEHVTKWNHASDDWHSPHGENDVRPGGTFNFRMEAKDGSQGFDFGGTYTEVEPQKLITYTMGDGRHVRVDFVEEGEGVRVTETFDAEHENSREMQQGGWQAILDNFKRHTEAA